MGSAGAAGVKAALEALSLRPNAALGQNFLCDEGAINAIADAAVCAGESLPVLEIGPGLGALTGALLARAPLVVAVEIDPAMVRALNAAFFGESRLRVIHADFLKCDIASIMPPGPFAVAGNLPYYITTPIVMKLLKSGLPIRSMTLMAQREAARRFFASPGTKLYGPLSVLSQYYYDAERLLSLSPQSYYPQPEVDSEVVRLTRRPPCAQTVSPGELSRLLEAAFAMRRKTLFNNLKPLVGDAGRIVPLLQRCGLKPGIRAEELSPQQFALLCRSLNQAP